jgi:hypothetical protein
MKMRDTLNPSQTYVIPQPEGDLSRAFFKIVVGSTALGLGCMAAAMEALRQDVGGFSFQVSAGTFMAFAVGLAAALLYWKMAARSLAAVRVSSVILSLAGVGGFLYPLRFVPADKMTEIAIGLGAATCAISIGAFLLWRLKRFFDAESAVVETKSVN